MIPRMVTVVTRRKWPILPTSRTGHAACWLALAFAGWLLLVDLPLAQLRDRDILPTPLFVAQVLIGFAVGLLASLLALGAIARSKERAFLVFASLIPGIFVVVALMFEAFVPH